VSIIALQSRKGGVGRTTLVALLAEALSRCGLPTTMMDLDPQDSLRLHCGLLEPGPGLSAGGIEHVELRPGLSRVSNSPADLALRLGAMRHAGVSPGAHLARWSHSRDVLIVDTASADTLHTRALENIPHLAVCVFIPDAASLAELAPESSPQTLYVLNQVDHRRPLSESALGLMRHAAGDRFLGLVRRDEAVPEALAHLTPLQDYAPGSVTVADIDVMAGELEIRLAALTVGGEVVEPRRAFGA
jgi:chromosome partitioning protein